MRKSASNRETVTVAAAVIERDGAFLATRRVRGTHLQGFWEFPGGKCEPGEGQVECLRRELREELDVDVLVGPEIYTTRFAYSDRVVELHFHRCELAGTPRPLLGQEIRWVRREDLATLPFLEADAQLVEGLARGEGG